MEQKWRTVSRKMFLPNQPKSKRVLLVLSFAAVVSLFINWKLLLVLGFFMGFYLIAYKDHQKAGEEAVEFSEEVLPPELEMVVRKIHIAETHIEEHPDDLQAKLQLEELRMELASWEIPAEKPGKTLD